ncbi:MAG: DNA-directed RNA polymerase subunit beta' [Chloroflexi bacterium]|nr:DNA-directed RNA polymerase subunit beta' [Chloroflexota bacterium]MCY3937714.1 DNA-directed RNA polymerase subunit beta' [Chloroflexota bacterium]
MLEVNDFDAIRIGLSSPEQIRSWSFGEVTKPETINYRTLKPERDGLFCERIFGPTKDWECTCGKYKRVSFKGIICDKCGVEVTRSRVRRERMGHVELATPVTHIWYFKGTPSRMGQLLNISPRNLEKIIYFASFIVTDLHEEKRDEALDAIDRDFEARVQEVRFEVEDTIASMEEDLENQHQALDSQVQQDVDRLQTKSEKEVRAIKDEAEKALKVLKDAKGEFATDDIKLNWLEDPTVVQGAKITPKYSKAVESAAEEAIAIVQQKLEQAAQDARERRVIQLEIEQDRVAEARANQENAIKERVAETRAFFERRKSDLGTLAEHQLLSELRYQELMETCGDVFEAASGGEAVLKLILKTDLDELAGELRTELRAKSIQRRRKAMKRLRVVEAFRRSGNRPEWMILTVLPILPPELRPMVQLDGGRFATSDLNDLYRRVINRNNRLKRLIELGAPEIIVRNEKRMLQEAVDALVDNGRRGRPVTGSSSHPYKSLSDLLRGKQGRFRQNLLGKRVDYSGRSVIVVGPELKLDECGLPTRMALELFKPFVMRRLVDYGLASNIKSAKRVVERADPEVWDILEEVTRNHPILLNRAPTLHRLGIQAFNIRLVQGSAIQVHPLVCFAFNADFDGDQMAVHVPLSMVAQEEARNRMMSTRNLLSPADGSPVISPTKDMVLGCYYLTLPPTSEPEKPKIFGDFNEVMMAFTVGNVTLHESVKVRVSADEIPVSDECPEGSLLDTTPGRVFLNDVLPLDMRFVNRHLDKGDLKQLVTNLYYFHGEEVTSEVADNIMMLGFRWATQSGVTMAIGDLTVPPIKAEILEDAERRTEELDQQFQSGIITEQERYNLHVRIWAEAMRSVSNAVEDHMERLGPVYLMGASGAAKGNFDQIRQIAGMRGLMTDPAGRIIEMPVRANFREGLSVFEYFISTHGARKGLADTALRTADSGYLTRRLVDVCQETIITMEDCGAASGLEIRVDPDHDVGESVPGRSFGRVLFDDVVDPGTGEILLRSGEVVDREGVVLLDSRGIDRLVVRSPMSCEAHRGVCQKCYGNDLARNQLVALGTAVGIIAAQSIGEPATQLTMRTFHTGGTYQAEDITRGLPRVEELFEARVPKGQAVVSDIDGVVQIVREDESVRLRVSKTETFEESIDLGAGFEPSVKEGADVREGHVVATGPDPVQANGEDTAPTEFRAPIAGKVSIEEGKITIRREESDSVEYPIVVTARLSVSDGDEVIRGQRLTEGPINPHDILRTRGESDLHRYLLSEIQSVYRIVGVPVHDKHIEIVIRQMLRKVLITEAGDTDLLPDELVDRMRFDRTNEAAIENSAEIARGTPVLLGVTKASLNTDSFLAAASFQDTTRVLTEAAIRGSNDRLRGLKENVIIGKLIPAGTGFRASMADFTVTVDDGDSEADGGAPKAEDVFAKVEGPVGDEAHADSDGGSAANGRDQALIVSDGGADSIDAGKENAETADDGA